MNHTAEQIPILVKVEHTQVIVTDWNVIIKHVLERQNGVDWFQHVQYGVS